MDISFGSVCNDATTARAPRGEDGRAQDSCRKSKDDNVSDLSQVVCVFLELLLHRRVKVERTCDLSLLPW